MGDNQTEDIHAAYLHWMEEASAYRLAELADCGAPNSKLSPGAEILGEVRDAVIERWRAGRFDYDTDRNDGDLVMECAEEGIIPVASHEIVALFVDLAAWTEENEFTQGGKWEGSFIDMFQDAISQITDRAARAFIAEVRDDFDQNFICPECGDTGAPHICYPGDCRSEDEEKAAYAASLAVPAEEGWECPRCGDNIPPVHCTPDECCDPPECPDPDCLHEDNTPGCVYSDEYDSVTAEAVPTGPVNLPADPFRGHPDYAGEDWQRDHASPVSAEPTEPPVSHPILDLIVEAERAEKASPGDETAAFLANMAKVNEIEFASRRRRRARLKAAALAAGLIVGWVVGEIALLIIR